MTVRFFLWRVQETFLSSNGGERRKFDFRQQARAVVGQLRTEHAEDGVQHLAGDCHQGLEFGFVACDHGLNPQILICDG